MNFLQAIGFSFFFAFTLLAGQQCGLRGFTGKIFCQFCAQIHHIIFFDQHQNADKLELWRGSIFQGTLKPFMKWKVFVLKHSCRQSTIVGMWNWKFCSLNLQLFIGLVSLDSVQSQRNGWFVLQQLVAWCGKSMLQSLQGSSGRATIVLDVPSQRHSYYFVESMLSEVDSTAIRNGSINVFQNLELGFNAHK